MTTVWLTAEILLTLKGGTIVEYEEGADYRVEACRATILDVIITGTDVRVVAADGPGWHAADFTRIACVVNAGVYRFHFLPRYTQVHFALALPGITIPQPQAAPTN